MRKWTILILMIFIMPMVMAEVQVSTDGVTWVDGREYGVVIQDDTILVQGLEQNTAYSIRARNSSTDPWTTINSTTDASGAGESDVNMTALALTIFTLLVTAVVFILPTKVRFVKNEVGNLIVKRSVWLLGIYLMVMNTGMMFALAQDAGLSVGNFMVRYIWMFGWGGYMFMIYLVVRTIIDAMSLWDIQKMKKRMGENDE